MPPTLNDGEEAFDLLVDAADAAQQWALIYRTNPPPYAADTAQGLADAQAMSDAALEFQLVFGTFSVSWLTTRTNRSLSN